MDLFPGMGSMMGQMAAPVMKQVVDFRERQRAQGCLFANSFNNYSTRCPDVLNPFLRETDPSTSNVL